MKKDCKNFIQYYGFNKETKHFFRLEKGHCTKRSKLDCENCPYYIPQKVKNERMYFAVNMTMIYIKKVLDKLEQEISKM